MALQLRPPLPTSGTVTLIRLHQHSSLLKIVPYPFHQSACGSLISVRRKRRTGCAPAGKEVTEVRGPGAGEGETKVSVSYSGEEETTVAVSGAADGVLDAGPEDLEYVRQIKRVLELLRKNRDMIFNEVKLTIMIDDPREAERKRLLGIEDPDELTRDALAAALEDVNEGRIPENRVALRLLAEEMMSWPNLEVEAQKKKVAKSLYASATDTGIDPAEAAKRLNIDWDRAAEIEEDDPAELEVPPAVGYGALYLVTGLPLLIGISVVLILFYNSLQ